MIAPLKPPFIRDIPIFSHDFAIFSHILYMFIRYLPARSDDTAVLPRHVGLAEVGVGPKRLFTKLMNKVPPRKEVEILQAPMKT